MNTPVHQIIFIIHFNKIISFFYILKFSSLKWFPLIISVKWKVV